ncbi:MAG: hypothetical protein ABF982_14040 [Lacticaseibacillus paracasei]
MNRLVHLVAELADGLGDFDLLGLDPFECGQIFLTDQVGLLLKGRVGVL